MNEPVHLLPEHRRSAEQKPFWNRSDEAWEIGRTDTFLLYVKPVMVGALVAIASHRNTGTFDVAWRYSDAYQAVETSYLWKASWIRELPPWTRLEPPGFVGFAITGLPRNRIFGDVRTEPVHSSWE